MQQKISKYIISIILCLVSFSSNAQKKIIESADTIKVPLFNGFTVQADIVSVISPIFGKSNSYSYEAGIQADLKHKYYPIVELGLAGANKTAANSAQFITNAAFGRIGIDFNILKTKKESKPTNNLILVGGRLGMSNFNYSISNITISDGYWGGSENVNYSNVPTCTKIWWELTAGVRVEVIKSIYMGWTVRNKNLLTKDVAGNVSPWFIPGYGLNADTGWGVNYTLGYHF